MTGRNPVRTTIRTNHRAHLALRECQGGPTSHPFLSGGDFFKVSSAFAGIETAPAETLEEVLTEAGAQ